jgi:hypothetical protein
MGVHDEQRAMRKKPQSPIVYLDEEHKARATKGQYLAEQVLQSGQNFQD